MAVSRLTSVKLKLALRCHILNPLWHDRMTRRHTRQQRESEIVCRYITEHHLNAAGKAGSRDTGKGYQEDWHIWSIWLQGERNAPPVVKACLKSIRNYYPDRLIVLDKDSIPEYISLPETIMEKYRRGKIRDCHFTDICRIELLHTYGGYWMDATCFMTSPIPKIVADSGFFMFLAGNINSNTLVQNCFIASRCGSLLLEKWRAVVLDYWMTEDSAVCYFVHQLIFRTLVENDKEAAYCFGRMPKINQDPTHLIWYGYADKAFDSHLIEDLNEKGFFYQKTSWKDTEAPVPGSFKDWILHNR